jgi:hypothetical protein
LGETRSEFPNRSTRPRIRQKTTPGGATRAAWTAGEDHSGASRLEECEGNIGTWKFLVKPFLPSILKSKIRCIIKGRRKLDFERSGVSAKQFLAAQSEIIPDFKRLEMGFLH